MTVGVSRQNVRFANPEEFEASLAAMAGGVRFRPSSGTALGGTASLARLGNVGLLAIDSDPLNAFISPSHGFYGLTVTLNGAFNIAEGSRTQSYDRCSGHLLLPDRGFDFRTVGRRTRVLGTNFFIDDLDAYAQRLDPSIDSLCPSANSRIPLSTPAGAGLVRYLMFVWGELARGGGLLGSELVAKEIEDGLIAAFICALQEPRKQSPKDNTEATDRRISRAEEFLLSRPCQPVSRAELAEVAGMSIRSLSRGFKKRHGVGPITFLKHRRLEAARLELMTADPGSTSVSEIALRYGFSELGKFSVLYKATFHESPSETLRH
jgi:AraC-like DNA-binding protein